MLVFVVLFVVLFFCLIVRWFYDWNGLIVVVVDVVGWGLVVVVNLWDFLVNNGGGYVCGNKDCLVV